MYIWTKGYIEMKVENIKRRTSSVRRQLKKSNLTHLIVTKPANVTYITGFAGDDSWALISPGNVYLITDSRYTEQAQKECPVCEIIERSGPITKAVAGLIKKQKSRKSIALESSVSIAAYEKVKENLKRSIKSATGIIETVRAVKDSDEAALVKKAATIAAKALRETLKFLKPPITENEFAGLLEFNIRKAGAAISFDTIVAFGANSSRPHHRPGKRKLRQSDTILIDFGTKYQNYCCDVTRCFSIGKPAPLYQKAYKAVKDAQAAAIKKVKAGVRIKKVDDAARKVIADAGLPVYGHGTGHGLGLEVHEGPVVSRNADGKLKAGQIITIEPGVYIPGKLGIRIEDDVLVTKTGCQVLTRSCPYGLALLL
jgi:Xaa-Pro aminopeptidase